MLNIFIFTTYRDLLREALLAKKTQFGRAYTFAKMAQACKLQHTYLSTVLKGEGDLSADQVFAAAEYLGLSSEEYEFLRLLHEQGRSVHPQRRRLLERQIEATREKGLRTEAYVEASPLPSLDSPALAAFYLDPNAQYVHMLLTLPKYRHDPERARRALGMDPASFNASLLRCAEASLLSLSGRKIKILIENAHFPKASPLYPAYRSSMRLKALEFMQTHESKRHYSFSVLYSASEDTRSKIQSKFLEFVEWAQKITQEGEADEVYQMNFDLLKWSDFGDAKE